MLWLSLRFYHLAMLCIRVAMWLDPHFRKLRAGDNPYVED